MVNKQYWNSKRSIRASLLVRIDAEIYHWYNQQIDLKESVDEIPSDFIKHLQGRDDFVFFFSWDGTFFESNIQYSQDDGIIKTIKYTLNVINGTQEHDITDEEIE